MFQAPAGWTIKSVTVDGHDVTDVPIELSSRGSIDDIRVVLTDKLTDLTGTVTDSRGTPLKDYVVILLPTGLKDGVSTRRFISMLGFFLLRFDKSRVIVCCRSERPCSPTGCCGYVR